MQLSEQRINYLRIILTTFKNYLPRRPSPLTLSRAQQSLCVLIYQLILPKLTLEREDTVMMKATTLTIKKVL